MVSSTALKNEIYNFENEFPSIPQDEVKWCAVTLSDIIKAGKRLEASVFDIDGKHAYEAIENCRYKSIPLLGTETNGFVSAYVCGRFKRIWLEHSDFPIFQPSSITDIKPEPDGYISERTNTDIDALKVKYGQILLTCSGTIGKITLVSKTLDNQIFSHDLIRMNVYNKNDIGFVYAYLRSEIGSTILQTNRYGAVIQHIEPEHLTDIPVPNPPEQIKRKINNLIIQSFELRDESNELIDKATSMLVEELKLPPINEFNPPKFDNKSEINSFGVKLSDMDGRLDASYHIPIAESITEHLRKYAAEVTTVGDKRVSDNIVLPGRFKRIYVEKGQGHVFFGGKQLYELDPSNKKYLSISKHSARIKSELEISENTILITRSGTIGKVTITPKHWEHWIASDHIIRLVPINSKIAGFLYIFLSSEYGYSLITRFTYGSVVDEIDANHVSRIPLPFLKNKDIQAEINNLALEANRLRYEAYKLEQQALLIMDNEVIFV